MKYALLALIAWSGGVLAADDPSCAGAPGDAVLTIPKPVDEWAKVSCTEFGHTVTYSPSYGWFSHKSKKLISFRAQTGNDKPLAGKHDFYFTRIEVEKHSQAISEVWSSAYMPEIFFSFTGYDVPEEIPAMYDVTFVTNKGQRLGLNFFVYKEGVFGNSCWENCVPINGFAVVRRPSNLKKAEVPPDKSPKDSRGAVAGGKPEHVDPVLATQVADRLYAALGSGDVALAMSEFAQSFKLEVDVWPDFLTGMDQRFGPVTSKVLRGNQLAANEREPCFILTYGVVRAKLESDEKLFVCRVPDGNEWKIYGHHSTRKDTDKTLRGGLMPTLAPIAD